MFKFKKVSSDELRAANDLQEQRTVICSCE